MSHLVCPLCGKNAPLSSFPPEKQDLDLKLVSFKGLGRGRGFAKCEEFSILGNNYYTQVVADRVNELYSMLVRNGFIAAQAPPGLYEANELKEQLRSLKSENFSYVNEINDLKGEVEEIELRSQVYYLILRCLSIDDSAKLISSDGEYQLELSSEPTILNLFLMLLVKEVPDQLRKKLLPQINSDNYPLLELVLKNVSKEISPIAKLVGDGHSSFKGLSYSGREPYLTKLSEVKEIVRRLKDKCSLIYSDPHEFNSWMNSTFNLGERIQGEPILELLTRLIKKLEDRQSKRLMRDLFEPH